LACGHPRAGELAGHRERVIGLFGVGSTKNEQIWLLNRLMTGRLFGGEHRRRSPGQD
jgi:hypothetical protein